MLYQMKEKSDIKYIRQYGKAYGAFLLHCLLHDICDINNFFVFDSIEELKKIEDKLPEIVILRADAKIGEKPTLGVRGKPVKKADVASYIDTVKESNPNGVVLCMDTNTENQNKSIDGSFNVYFDWGEKVYIDYLGAGFDVGGITKGEENHESWSIDWDNLLFVKSNNMNLYRTHLISDKEYQKSAERKIQSLMKENGCNKEEATAKVPETYKPMPLFIKEALLDKIVFELYSKQQELKKLGLKSFGVQGMIRGGELFPVEINRMERFIEKEVLSRTEKGYEER